MNKIILISSFIIIAILINLGIANNSKTGNLNEQIQQLQASNSDLEQKIAEKKLLPKQDPVPIAYEYGAVINQIRLLESNSGTNMSVQLDGGPSDSEDISTHYENSEYTGIRGLKLQILVNKFSTETDMGAVLDDIHTLEKNTDFITREINKDNNNLIVKGEVYGL